MTPLPRWIIITVDDLLVVCGYSAFCSKAKGYVVFAGCPTA
jgi:hypothetical protein